LALSVSRRLHEVVDEKKMYEMIGNALANRTSDTDAIDELKRIDLTKFMKDAHGLNEPFPCSFLSERKAWIFKSRLGFYRYYSRMNASVFSFDIIDLLCIFRNESKKEVLNFLQKNWELEGLTPWYLEQKEKYRSNQELLESLQQEPKEYPNLHKMIGKHWKVLEAFNQIALENLSGKEISTEQQPIFFLSNHYFRKTFFPERSVSTINNLINLFCILGFARKIPFEKIPPILSKEAYLLQIKNQKNNHTSYYYMTDWREILQEAERRAEEMVRNHISYYGINKKKIAELFGEAFAKTIYVQQTHGKKKKAEPIFVKEENHYFSEAERLEQKFLEDIRKTGKCAKSTLYQSSLLPYRRFDAIWKSLVEKYQFMEKYPTKEEIQRYGLGKRLLIAVPAHVHSYAS